MQTSEKHQGARCVRHAWGSAMEKNLDPICRDRVRAIRTAMNLNISQFAMQLAVTRQTVNNWESGRTSAAGPTLVLLHQLAEKHQA